MLKPNWFDKKYDKAIKRATAEDWMSEIVNDKRLVKSVKAALAEYDEREGMPGPSRSQAVRSTLARVLQED